MSTLERARAVLAEVWGYSDFRSAQRRTIVAVMAQRDVLALLPTGGGKSLCFQVPALSLEGTTVVVSPLISLMQDQVAALRKRDVAAAYLSSTQSPSLQAAVWEYLLSGRIRILYIAPERMPQLLQRASRLAVPLLAIDEAHCISEWGHDFRPHYRSLGQYRRQLGEPPTIAVTATATGRTQDDIVRVLRLKRPVVVRHSFDRPNLHFVAEKFTNENARLRKTVSVIQESEGSTIIYVPTRNRTDGVTAVLRWWNIPAFPYHAGLPARERRMLLQKFMNGGIRVMVATNAFGMGIDKPDVRRVIHLGVPTRPEAYYQEAGRAGRDGKPARCMLFWMHRDFRLATLMATGEGVSEQARGNDELMKVRKEALNVMRRYVQTRACRRRVLLEFFAEKIEDCAGCDRCVRAGQAKPAPFGLR